jgi:hypothetical protein
MLFLIFACLSYCPAFASVYQHRELPSHGNILFEYPYSFSRKRAPSSATYILDFLYLNVYVSLLQETFINENYTIY